MAAEKLAKATRTDTAATAVNPDNVDLVAPPDAHDGDAAAHGAHRKLYRARWGMLAILFILNVGCAAIGPFYFSSVSTLMTAYYDVDSFQINVFGLISTIVGIPATVAAMMVQERRGVRLSCFIAAGLTTIGTLLVFLGNFAGSRSTSYILAVTGQVFTCFSQPFTLNASTKLAAEWFGERERATANTLAQLGNPIGLAIIYLVAPVIVGDSHDGVSTLNMVVFIVCACCSALSLLMRDKPPTPPSLSSAKPKENFLEGVKDCARNPQFGVLLFSFSLIVACFTALQTYLADLLVPYGFDEGESGTVGAIFIGCGIVAAIVNGVIMDRTQKHKTSLKILSFIGLAGVVIFTIGVPMGSRELAYTGAAVYGAGGFPCMPLMMELGAECTFPVGEATSTNVLQIGPVLVGIVLILAISALRKPDQTLRNGMILFISFQALAHVLTWLYTAESRRIVLDEKEVESERKLTRNETEYTLTHEEA
ncbi:MFS general substrate transporter [Gonapodya prolifera JEL478]|uniref:MFS general substrate transporter n=1 Tax=Gonapodya prolifera (strain JEL478) TaxID=1344416 RepID=A0A139B0L8_GONPJ|nr:MFS general substrate transporter [Gonapodya prolifera JEL478]|eukprot:KXS22519.1 MFS general substrate transporter [Gonapodya prolifera JEL478]